MNSDTYMADRPRYLAAPGGAIAYTRGGSGPPLVLVHGLGGTRGTWAALLPLLEPTFTVIAVDLPGHGDSDAPLGDYSPGAQASALRDLVVGLGFERVSLVGHSLGGGAVMQFAYEFPERTERLVLIGTGGLGSGVSPLLRAGTLPGAEALLSGLALLPRSVAYRALEVLSLVPNLMPRGDAVSIADALVMMGSQRHRHTFVQTARTVLDRHGRVLSATGSVPALVDIPILIAWGTDDKAIPPEHHPRLSERLPNAVTLEVPHAGHFPHETAPVQVADAMTSFLRSSGAHEYDEDRWRSRVVLRSPAQSQS